MSIFLTVSAYDHPSMGVTHLSNFFTFPIAGRCREIVAETKSATRPWMAVWGLASTVTLN